MKIVMVGAGYVGLVTGACLADSGNQVVGVDVDAKKVERLKKGEIPIFEPGLAEVVVRNQKAGRLDFTTNLAAACDGAEMVFLAVGTPESDTGEADLTYLWSAAEAVSKHLGPKAIVVVKSTVPVGTNSELFRRFKQWTGRDVDLASNPEFLKEGAAIDDFTRPDRVVVGVRSSRVGDKLKDLYAPFLRTERPFLAMSPESAEMTKYVANCMLATKISFINEMANFCEAMAADVNDVRRGIGHDQRIGFQFLHPGAGYGGSCFPKDVRALQATARRHGLSPKLLSIVDEVNEQQKRVLQTKIEKHFGGKLSGETIAVWGLSFKPRTDDVREASSLVLIRRLLELGAKVQVHDPEAMENVRRELGDAIQYFDGCYDALAGASALAIVTEWNEFRHPDFREMKRRMKSPVIFDGRNLYTLEQMSEAGFTYHSIGRAIARPAVADPS